jgi:Tfp pilus assembly protein PilO
MKTGIEDLLHQLDHNFKEKSQKDIYMTYIMILAVFFAISYLFFWESSFENFEQQNKEIITVETNIKNDALYLKYNTEEKIAQLEAQTLQANNETILHKDNNAYIKNKIEAISFLIYDERAWGEYLHSISINAKKYDIKILLFTNELAQTNTSFGHVLDINIKSAGEYKNTLNFINSLEQSELVVDLHDFNITAKDGLISDLNISVWGITY